MNIQKPNKKKLLEIKNVKDTEVGLEAKAILENKAKRPSGDWDHYPSLFPTMDISFLFSALVSSPRTCRGLLECPWTLASFSKFSDSLINGA